MSDFNIPRPDGVSFNDWASRVAEELASKFVPMPSNEEHWTDWAASLLYSNDLVGMGVPSPQGFNNWREWAQQFVESVR